MQDIHQQIEQTLADHAVVLYMKGTPEAPMCGFSKHVADLLESIEQPFHAVNVLADNAIREGIKTYSNWPTIPQCYVAGEFIGGCDILDNLFQKDALQKTIQSLLQKAESR